jgi:GNAT superfamily N-acetyltransferase
LAYKIKVGDEYHRCYMGCHALVHPDFRRSALYGGLLKLQAMATAVDGVTLYGFPKELTIYRVRAAGFAHVARVPLLVRPLAMAALVARRIPKLARRIAMTLAWPIAAQTVYRPRWSNAWRWGLKAIEAETFDGSFDRFWERVAPKYNVTIARDRAFLLWRFRGASFRSYTILTARAGDELVGYAILRDYEIDGVRAGMIADLMVEPGARGDSAGLLLVNEATRRLKANGMALAGALMMPHVQEYEILRKAGYIEPPPRMSPQTFRIVAHPFRYGPYQGEVPPAEQWFFTMADHDAI